MTADGAVGDEHLISQGSDELVAAGSEFGGDTVRRGDERKRLPTWRRLRAAPLVNPAVRLRGMMRVRLSSVPERESSQGYRN